MRKYIFVCLFLTLFLFLIQIPAVNSAVLATGSTVEGKTIGEWTAEWWKWAYSQTVPNDAFTDTTGANAAVGQTGPVFFIAGTTGGTATRSFTVPGDKFLLVPLINVSFSEVDYGGPATEEQLRIAAATSVSLIDSLIAEIDGIPVPGDLFSHRELSPLFSFVAATDNPFGFPPGPSGNAVADGYWLMLEPLGEGTHTVRFGGGASEIGFTVEVIDTITAVSPGEGCTRSQGYWKTHSEYGPAPYDDTWSELPDGADTPIFIGGPSYYEVLWTEPKGGNAYFILAQQYIAFMLNVASGASVPYDNEDLRDAIFGSLLLLDMYKDTLTIPKKSLHRELALEYAKILDDYNNGYIGPGSCNACIDIEKFTEISDADVLPGPSLPVGNEVRWRYAVTNCGNVSLTQVSVTDDQGVTVTCPQDNLVKGESMTCTASGTVQLGQYVNTGIATGTAWNTTIVQDEDLSHYFGVDPNEIIGETTAPITRDYRYESSMGDFITDAMRAYDASIDFAIQNSGGLRADIDTGQITFGGVFSVLPFANTMVIVELDGNEVRQVLEEGVTDKYGLVQVSGLQFTFDYDAPVGSRIVGDVIDLNTGLPLVPSATYYLAVNDFYAGGAQGNVTLATNLQIDTGMYQLNIVVDWIKANSPFTPPDPSVEQRITALGTAP